MAELRVRVPGEPDRTVPLSRPLVLGRADDCDVQILDKKASKRHLRVEPAPGGGWLAVDLGSSNGTLVGDERILRRALASGDVVRIGDVTLEVLDDGRPAAPVSGPAVVLSGALTEEHTVVPLPVPEAAAPAPEDGLADDGPSIADVTRARVAGRRAVSRAAALCAAGCLVLVGVQVFVGGVADERVARRTEAEEYERLLARRDEPADRWREEYRAFLADHPRSRYRADLDLVAAAKEASDRRLAEANEELLALHRNAVGRSEAEVVGRLRSLRDRLPADSPLVASVRIALESAERRLAEATARELGGAEADADRALARGDVAAAMRRLTAFESSHPLLSAEDDARLQRRRATVREAAATLAAAAIARAGETSDPDAKRAVLVAALRGLADSVEADRLRSALAAVSGGAVPTAAPTVPGTAPSRPPSAGPAATPGALAALQAKVADAERLVRERAFAAAAAAYAGLAAAPEAPARRKDEWTERAADLARVAHLVDDLAADAADGSVPRAKLSGGTFEVVAADASGVRLRRGDAETTTTFASMAPEDLLVVLSVGKETDDRRLALAVLAVELGDRVAAMRHLVALAERPTHRDAAFRLMAHRLEGRSSVPDGGYFPFEGELLGKAEFERRSETKHLAALADEARKLAEQVAKDPAFKGLEKLRARRDELDRRRAFALLAIFDETHWPYPHDEPAVPARVYAIVTEEVDRRWRSVAEVWNEPLKVVAPKGEAVEKAVARHAAIVRELESKGVDVEPLKAAIAPYGPYVGAGTLTIRSYYRDEVEKELLEYNRWVMEVYNPTKTTVATEAELEQIRITNEYRVMMGYAFGVQAGPDPIASIDPKNLLEVLATNVETRRVPLHAVRVDDRLVTSARAHSRDMATRGFFDHFAPPNPATGEGRTSPFDRMQKAGYTGGGMSENICAGGGPMDAHIRWLHSSGHHRNILSDWVDMGSGFSGPWTQNFGAGGGAPPKIPGREAPTTEGGG